MCLGGWPQFKELTYVHFCFDFSKEASYPTHIGQRRRHTLVKFFVLRTSLFFITIIDVALKFAILFHYHYLHQQTRIQTCSSVNVSVKIMSLFLLRILVKFFRPPHLFSKPLQIQLIHLQYLFTIITFINRQEYITLSRLFLQRIMALFQFRILVKVFISNPFFKNIQRYSFNT